MRAAARDRFLAAFEPAVRPHIIEFGKHLTNLDADVAVLMARKAACLVDAMADADLTRITAAVTSERSLDMALAWVHGKRVALIDDVLITGTSLHAARERLLAAGAAEVTTHVLSVDSSWNAGLVQPEEPYLVTDDSGSVRLCTQIVEAISTTPRPYNVDWPLFDDVSIPTRSMHMLTSMTSWRATNTATSKQYTNDVWSVTHDATGIVGAELDDSLGWPVSRAAPLIKVRILGMPPQPGDRRTRLRVMPIVGFEALPIAAIDSLFTSISTLATDQRATLFDDFISPTSRLRLVQYVAAARLFAVWLDEMRELTDIEAVDTLDLAQMRYAFPPHLAPLIQRACSSAEPLLGLARSETRDPQVRGEPAAPGPFTGSDPESVQARLTHPFHLFYRDREIPARIALRSGGLPVLTDPRYTKLVGRLRTGHNLSDLERVVLSGGCPPGGARLAVSRFLDMAVDHGVVVPIIEARDGKLQRAYRHGEDILFARTEQRLFHLMLQQLASTAHKRSLNRIVVEKAFVLLLRAGVAKGFLNVWTGRMGAAESVGIRYDLYGAVVERDAPELFGPMHNQSLARFMVNLGTLEETEDGKYIPASELPEAPTSDIAEEEAKQIGILLGGLLDASQGAPRLSDDDLAFVATCPTDRDVALALAAEVDLIRRQWPVLNQHGFVGARNGSGGNRRETGIQRSVVYKAARSGADKMTKHHASATNSVVSRLADDMRGLERSQWVLLWAQLRNDELHRTDPQLNRLINRLGRWLLVAHLQFLLLRIGYLAQELHDGDATIHRRIGVLVEDARHVSSQLHSTDSSWTDRLAVLDGHLRERTLRPEAIIDGAVGIINGLVDDEAAGLIDHARAVASPFGQPRPVVTYTTALAIQIWAKDGQSHPARSHVRKLAAVVNARRKYLTDRDGRLSVVRLSGDGDVLLCATGPSAREGLAGVVADLISSLASQCSMHMLAIPELTEDLQPYEAEGSGHCHASALTARIGAERALLHPSPGNLITVTAPGSAESVQRYLDTIQQRARGVSFDVTAPTPTTQRWGWVSATMVGTANGTTGPKSRFDIAVITVVAEQTAALREALLDADDFAEWLGPGRRWFTSGTLTSLDGSIEGLRVVTTQTMDQGNRSVITAYNELKREGRTKLAVLIDIAGGIHRDVKLGDVVVADRIIYYDQRALTAEGTQRRGETFRLPTEIASAVNRFFTLNGEPAVLPATRHQSDRTGNDSSTSETLATHDAAPGLFRILKGPVASGEAVIKHREDDVRRWIHVFNDKTLAVETEAAGLAVAAHEEGRDNPSYGALVIRGISDHADEDKDDRWRKVAAAHAVHALRALAPAIRETLLSPATKRPSR